MDFLKRIIFYYFIDLNKNNLNYYKSIRNIFYNKLT